MTRDILGAPSRVPFRDGTDVLGPASIGAHNVRVLFLATGVFDKGGIARYSRYQIRALNELVGPTQVRVLSLLGPAADAFETPFEVHYQGTEPAWSRKTRFVSAVTEEWMSWRPTIVWTNHVNLLPLALPAALVPFGPRLVVNVYGLELWSSRQWLHQLTLLGADVVLADCHASAEFVARRYHIASGRLRVAWDCVDIEQFRPRPRRQDLLVRFGIPAGPQYRYVLTLGRMDVASQYKGYDRLLDALASLSADDRVIGIFAGEGDDRPRLEQRARDLGLAGRVCFVGSVAEDLLVDVYNLCDVFVLVSDRGYGRGEGLPLTPLEAAACGKPIIVGDEDGSREGVIEGENGHVVSPRHPDELRNRLLALLSNDEKRSRMGKSARARIEAEFSYEGFRDKLGDVLDVTKVGSIGGHH